MMLLICSTNLFGQINDNPSLQGNKDSLVVVSVNTLREANIKLTERLVLKEIVAQQDTIIDNKNIIIEKYKEENLYLAADNIELKKDYAETVELNNKLSKNIKCTKVGLYITSGISVVTISYIIISLLVNGK